VTGREYIDALYRAVLQRPPDAEGLEHWAKEIEAGRSPVEVLEALVTSDEYRRRQGGEPYLEEARSTVVRALRESRYGQPLFIVDVGAQILDWEDHIYQPLLASGLGCEVVGFEPLAHRLRERAEKESGACLTLLPYAIGDGRTHTLKINNDDGTSSLYPLNPEAAHDFADLRDLHTVGEERVETRRLDDVLPPRPVDFLKLDIQGFELHALEHATAVLFRTAVVHCETEFYPLYLGQPLFPQVHGFLTSHGFEFIDLVKAVRNSPPTASGCRQPDRLVFADSVFFRKLERGQDQSLLLAQACIALLVYKKPALAEWLLHRYDMMAGTQLARSFLGN
jgi:FkbM family methyltransferase